MTPRIPSLADQLMQKFIPHEEKTRSATQESYERNSHKPCSKCKTQPRNKGPSGFATSTKCYGCEKIYRWKLKQKPNDDK